MALRCVSRVPAFARHRALTARVSPLRSAVASPPASPPLSVSSWLSVSGVSVDRVTTSPSGRGLVLGGESPAQPGDVLCSIPEALCVTSADVAAHPTAGPLAEGRDALVGLALWLAAERHAGSGSQWRPLLDFLPSASVSPLMWSADTRARLLRGSDAEAAAAARIAAADEEWASFEASFSPSALAACGLSAGRNAFVSCLAVVIASAVWLSAADCFALVPLVGSCEQRAASPLSDGGGGLVNTSVDYDAGRCAVVLVATTRLAVGSRLVAADPQQRGAAELLLSTGGSEPGGFPGDTLAWRACLLPADRLYAAKAASLAAAGLAPDGQAFPFTGDALPNQLMGYLRLSRVTDAAELAAVRLDRDAPVSQLNEYEVLQLMVQEVRERLAGYEGGPEADDAIIEAAAQGGGGVSAEEAAAAGMRRCEKRLLAETAAGLRRRLAPIRGKPTKGGRMEAPNADILDIFSQLENITSAPRNIINEMLGWDEDGKPPKGGCSA